MYQTKSSFSLYTDKYLIRIVSIDEDKDYFSICNNIETCKYLTFKPFKSIKEARITIANMIRSYLLGESVNYSIYSKEHNKVVGSISLTFNIESNSAEIGYLLNHDFFNKRIMSTILPTFIIKSFEHYNLDKITACVNIKNIYSIKLLENNNFLLDYRNDNLVYYYLNK